MFFRKKKKNAQSELSFYERWRADAEHNATMVAIFVDVSPKQREKIFAETTDNDMLTAAVLAKRTEPDIAYICNKYRVPAEWAYRRLCSMSVRKVVDAVCLGDKIGSTREFTHHEPVTRDTLLLPTSAETDDSILTRAVHQAIRENPTAPNFRDAYIRAYRDNPNYDYGGGFIQWAQNPSSAGYGSCGDGCVMRIAPIVAFYNDYNEMIQHVVESVMPTHNHTESVKAAVVFAGVLWMARAGAGKAEILEYVKASYIQPCPLPEEYTPLYKPYVFTDKPYRTDIEEKRSLFAGFAVPMVVDHFVHTDDFEGCCLSLLSGFCDADTLCGMTGALCAMYNIKM